MALRKLTKFEDVVDALGGVKAVATLTDVWPATVYVWRRTGQFPARAMDRIEAELARKNASAARDLYDFDPPREYRSAEKRP